MNEQLIKRKFSDMGVAVSFERSRPLRFQNNQLIAIDVVENKKGEHFVLENPADYPVEVS